jgi:ABC-2 type transport system permease protein
MNLRFIIHDFKSSIVQWYRGRGTVFWSILFPILLILIFGSIFSGSEDIEYSIIIQDLDDTTQSNEFINILKQIDLLNVNILDKSENVTEYMKNESASAAMIIPSGFGSIIQQSFINDNEKINLSFYYDPSKQTTTSIIRSIIISTLNEYNMGLTGGKKVVGVDEHATIDEGFDYIDYFIPGMIGFTLMTSCIYGSIERNTKFRKAGILRKLLTMPISRTEWILAKMLFMMFLSFLSAFVILVVGIIVWGITVQINIYALILIISTSFLFSGMGMIISRFVKDEETADMAGGAITFPMMFLAGTFFPLDQMPAYLQTIAQFLPLYYVNEGLRNAMIYLNMEKTLFFTGFVLAFAFIFFIVGALITKWHED